VIAVETRWSIHVIHILIVIRSRSYFKHLVRHTITHFVFIGVFSNCTHRLILAELSAQGNCDILGPLVEGLLLDHVPELRWLNAKFVEFVFQLFKTLVDHVHYVLLSAIGIVSLGVVAELLEIDFVLERKCLDIPWHTQNRIFLQLLQNLVSWCCCCEIRLVEKVDLELGPA